jgi:hypothetical protein
MKLAQLIDQATDKNRFLTIEHYADFCSEYLDFIKSNLQAVIVSKNETNYQFFQYKADGTYNVTRPINSNLMLPVDEFYSSRDSFLQILTNIRENSINTLENRRLINNFIYTCQQSIGATLDALPATCSNTARKINGDLFERLILLIIKKVGVDVSQGTILVPIIVAGETTCQMSYQHDLIIKVDNETKAIGSVKTSSKDRLDKIFVDKFLYNRLTDTNTPHFAVFLNDVQRKGTQGKYGVNATFLPGHFRGYTVKLNPLDGVYYLDIRPNMRTEEFLKQHIKTFDNFIFSEIWKFAK